jgi:ParB family chromosome partitioning protein
MAKRTLLQKFLGQPEAGKTAEGLELRRIPLEDILLGDNVRSAYTEIGDLVQSIAEHGLIHPILVYRDGDHYVIKTGHRRYLAFQELKKQRLGKKKGTTPFDEIPCLMTDSENVEMIQLVENLQREDLSQMDIVRGLTSLKKKGMTNEKIGEVYGTGKQSVKNLFTGINEINENPKLQELLEAGATIQDVIDTKGVAAAEKRYELLEKRAAGEITRREQQATVQVLKQGGTTGSTPPLSHSLVEVTSSEDALTMQLRFADLPTLQFIQGKMSYYLARNKLKCKMEKAG